MKRLTFTAVFLLCLWNSVAAASDPTETILKRFTDDFAKDALLKKEYVFGIRVDQEMYAVHAQPGQKDGPGRVELRKGNPGKPTFYFKLNRATLEKLDRGEWNGLTAQAKAFESDAAPMDADTMEGYTPDKNFLRDYLDLSFHFWARGNPEVVVYGNQNTRFTHGADVTVFYYQPGLRTAWASLKKGMHANEDPKSQTNPFPSLIIFTRGAGMARIGGRELEVTEGQAMVVPSGITHEFWNPNEAPLEIVLIMFGEGA